MSNMQVDVELAREVAGTPLRNKDLQKRLWLKIAQHVIKKDNDIERCVCVHVCERWFRVPHVSSQCIQSHAVPA